MKKSIAYLKKTGKNITTKDVFILFDHTKTAVSEVSVKRIFNPISSVNKGPECLQPGYLPFFLGVYDTIKLYRLYTYGI